MTDTERLDWLENNDGCGLISDDAGNWAVSCSGFQNVPMNPPEDIQTSFFVEASEWRPSIREAIDAAIQAENDEEEESDDHVQQ